MTKPINDGGPAFPSPACGDWGPEYGMFLRDWFAGQAMANLYTHSEASPDKSAEWAYQVADAMLAAREETAKEERAAS